jgi:hypothetical protein
MQLAIFAASQRTDFFDLLEEPGPKDVLKRGVGLKVGGGKK